MQAFTRASNFTFNHKNKSERQLVLAADVTIIELYAPQPAQTPTPPSLANGGKLLKYRSLGNRELLIECVKNLENYIVFTCNANSTYVPTERLHSQHSADTLFQAN